MKLLLILLILLTIGITVYSVHGVPSFLSDRYRITAEEARHQRFSLFIDLRTPTEREEWGYYPNSIPIELSKLSTEVPYLLGQKAGQPSDAPNTTPILLYAGERDGRAKQGAKELIQKGYHGVRYLEESYLSLLPPGPLGRKE